MAINPISAVVFDLGGVLVDWNPAAAFRDVLPADEIEPFLAEIDFHGWNRGLDSGRPIAQAEADIDAGFPHRAGLIAAYRRNFTSTLVGEIAGTAQLIRELAAAEVRLLALTNWSAESFPQAREVYPVLELFEGIVVSGEEQIIKPDPAIFRILIDRHRLDPATTAFIDDVPVNVEAARAVGLHGIVFTDALRLRHDLGLLGLPVAPHP